MQLGIIIQARLGSSRLPRKITVPVDAGYTLLEYIVRSVAGIGKYPVVIAFPDDEEHRQFATTQRLSGADVFFGHEHDVLDRFIQASAAFGFSSVVRICSDNPFLNTSLLETLVGQWSEEYDYASFFNASGTAAMKTHYGLFAEVVKRDALCRVTELTAEKLYHEHVTPYLYENPDLFRLHKINMPEPMYSGIPLRLTLDTAEDLAATKQIIQSVDNVQDWEQVVRYCKSSGLLNLMEKEIQKHTK